MRSFSGVPIMVLVLSMVASANANLADLFNISVGQNNDVVRWLDDGRSATITLDADHHSAACQSKDEYLFGTFGVWIKLPAFDSAGTVTAFYLSSPSSNQCEFDFEFLGNRSGEPLVLATNVFLDGAGRREQQIYLPGGFDPSAAFHYYSIEWTADTVVWRIDNQPIREFKYLVGLILNSTFCTQKPMQVMFNIWDRSEWAMRGGKDSVNWAGAPFTVTYTNFHIDGCVPSDFGAQAC